MRYISLRNKNLRVVAMLIGMFFSIATLSGLATFFNPSSAAALSGSNFNAGHIIDDTIFTNNLAMSEQNIQTFLNAKIGTCDNSGSQASDHYNSATSSYYTDGQWAVLHGQSSTFTCINQYVENTSTLQNNYGNYTASVPGGISAAQIIYNAAQQYQINPEVILVTLQKEQGLVTDYWPWLDEYQYAMGYACPDTAAGCNTSYADFYEQVDSAAWQFRQYLTNPNNYNYAIGQDYIQYSPTASCGGSIVAIQNQATAALYDYTPYQPDAAALAGVSNSSDGGTGDSCSAYGNRNFWWYFNNWFGASLTSAYTWQYVGQNIYTDAALTSIVNPFAVVAGERYYLTLSAENIGTATWNQGQVNLGTANPANRTSPFYDSTWLSANRAATLTQTSVAPGATGTFGFWVTAPSQPGSYNEYFNLVMEGVTWMNPQGLYYPFDVQARQYTWQDMGQQVYTDQSETTAANLNSVDPGTRYYVTLQAKNMGNVTWNQGQVNLGTSSPYNRTSPFYDSTWLSANRAATLTQTSVAPGATGTFGFWVTAPLNSGGTFREYFNLVDEGVTWLQDLGQYYQFDDLTPNYGYSLVSQKLYTDSTESTNANEAALAPSTRYYASIVIENTGNAVWYPNKINLGTSNPAGRTSVFYDNSWLSPNRPATIQQSAVAPGQTATFNFWITTPAQAGNHNEYFNFVNEGVNWLPDIGLYYELNVT